MGNGYIVQQCRQYRCFYSDFLRPAYVVKRGETGESLEVSQCKTVCANGMFKAGVISSGEDKRGGPQLFDTSQSLKWFAVNYSLDLRCK